MLYPSYLNLKKAEWQSRKNKALAMLEKCEVCPRKCGVNRLKNERGFCRVGRLAIVASWHPHFGEEAPLVGQGGSGTIFFAHCNLGCVYCQNYDISQIGFGQETDVEKLAEIMIELQKRGCHNINFVTPSHVVPQILESLPLAVECGLAVPLVYNTSSYDSIKTLKLLRGIIDIYMPDVKYADQRIARRYSLVPNYPKVVKKAVKEMWKQVGDLIINSKVKMQNAKLQFKIENFEKIQKEFPEGVALRGLLVRHLVLPNELAGSKKIFNFLAKEISPNTFTNVMDQYQPYFKAEQYPAINRPINRKEYEEAVRAAKEAGLKRLYRNV